MSYNETVENKTSVLVALTQDIASFYHDWGDNVYHLTSDIACVDQEFVSTFWLFVESFLPKANPKFQGQTAVELRFKFGVEGEAFVFAAGRENFFNALLV